VKINFAGDYSPPAGYWLRSSLENTPGIQHFDGVKLMNYSALLLAAMLLAGCKKADQLAAINPEPIATLKSSDDNLPKQAQPKLPTMKLFLGAEILDAELALTEVQIQTGMMFRTNILDTDSMLFDLRIPQRANFWMMHCPESISAAYITPDGVITEIHHLEKNDTNGVVAATDNIRFVLETSDGWFARHNVNTGMVVRTEKGSLADTFPQR
jgi:uncharacterized membrane protein (UPF0127 family)